MKPGKSFRVFCLLMAALLCITALSSALAMPPSMFTPLDAEKLYAFWQQPAYDGMNNGEAVYDYEVPDFYNVLYNYSYGGGYLTELVTDTVVGHATGFYFRFTYRYCFSFVDGDIAVDGWDYPTPDLYGDLDLAETGVIEFGSAYPSNHYPVPHQTHITSVLLDNCQKLERAYFNAQDHCTEFSALNCPNLAHISLKDGVFNHIAFDMNGSGEVNARSFGAGSIGVEYEDGIARFFAYPEKDSFLGWFLNGELVSTELEAEITEGGELTACFGGDANGDGNITISDALIVLRTAMGGNDPQDANMLDVDGSGTITVADAILIARFALGL